MFICNSLANLQPSLSVHFPFIATMFATKSDHEVCRLCGSLTECPHDTEAGDKVEPRASPLSTTTTAFENTCDMVTRAPILPFSEVFNTYGEHLTNAQLLAHYGFVLDVNENDVTSWDDASLCRFAEILHDSTVVGEDTQDPSKSKNASHGHPESPYLHLRKEAAVQQCDTNHRNTDGVAFGRMLLRRLVGILELWDREEGRFSGSDLVYLPSIAVTDSEKDTCGT